MLTQTTCFRISISPFFNETADNGPTMNAMRNAVIAALKAEKIKRDSGDTATEEWFKDLEPKLLQTGAVILAGLLVKHLQHRDAALHGGSSRPYSRAHQ